MGAEPPPDGINVIERHVGHAKWKEAKTAAQSQAMPDPESWAKAWKETVTPAQSQENKGRARPRRRRRPRLDEPYAEPSAAASAPQQGCNPVSSDSLAIQASLHKAIEALMPTMDPAKVSFRILRERAAELIGVSADALDPHKAMVKSLVKEWLKDQTSGVDQFEAGPETEELIEASQRPGCAAQVTPGTPSAAPQIEVREVTMVHSVSPAIAVLLHGSASTKKSFTSELTTDFMTKSEHAATDLHRRGRCLHGGSLQQGGPSRHPASRQGFRDYGRSGEHFPNSMG